MSQDVGVMELHMRQIAERPDDSLRRISHVPRATMGVDASHIIDLQKIFQWSCKSKNAASTRSLIGFYSTLDYNPLLAVVYLSNSIFPKT